jgi:hypothetical protein
MSLTREESALMDQRDTLNDAERRVLNDTIDVLFRQGRIEKVPIATDDRCASVEAALIGLIIKSRKGVAS